MAGKFALIIGNSRYEDPSLGRLKAPDIDVQGLAAKAKNANWFVLVNGEDLYLEKEQTRHYAPEEQRTYHMFYTVDYIKSLFPNAEILPPVNDEMQHCCIIRI